MERRNVRIAIVGAGMAGLTIAKLLKDIFSVEIFEKSRGPGGRMSTRHEHGFQFDHGAQSFTAHSKEFQTFIRPFIDQQRVTEWRSDLVLLDKKRRIMSKFETRERHFLASPKMNALAKDLCDDLPLTSHTEISRIERSPYGWLLTDIHRQLCGTFDWVILSNPAAQANKLMPDVFSEKRRLSKVKQDGCYALMLGFDSAIESPYKNMKVQNSIVDWVSFDTMKPGRNQRLCSIIIHSTSAWAEKHLNEDRDWISATLIKESLRRF